MSDLEMFCRQVRARSYENAEAIALLHRGGVTSQVVSVLRQELDSMVRVIFLLSIDDMAYRERLIKDSVEGRRWKTKDGKKNITDKEMVDLANTLHGWTASVYKFGCAFIHLSNLHDHNDRDPTDGLAAVEKADLLHYLRYYHGGPTEQDPKMRHIVPLLPSVFQKIASNLEWYIKSLEAGRSL